MLPHLYFSTSSGVKVGIRVENDKLNIFIFILFFKYKVRG